MTVAIVDPVRFLTMRATPPIEKEHAACLYANFARRLDRGAREIENDRPNRAAPRLIRSAPPKIIKL